MSGRERSDCHQTTGLPNRQWPTSGEKQRGIVK